MPDDILARYEHLSHRELYTMLMHGSTDQIDSLVATWKTMETTVSALAASLRADLDRLRLGWDSPAGREFDRRVGLIAEFAQTLAEEFCAIHTGLSVMSAALADAKSKAEHPDQPPHPDPLPQNLHGVGTLLHLLGNVVEGVIGSQLGHELDPAEKEKARNRMVQVVCTLAAEYRVVDYGTWPPRVPPPPADTPTVRPEHVTVASAPVVVAQPEAQPATEPVAAPVDPSIHKPRHGHPDLPLPVAVPGLVDHTTNQQGPDFWGGTGPAIAAGVGLVAAGGVVAAAAIKSRHTKTSLGDDENIEPAVEPDTDGVVRSHPVPVGGGEGTTANLTAVGHDHSGVSATGGPIVHTGSELAGSSREGAVSVGSVGADGDTRGPGTAPPPPAVMGGMPGAPGGPGAAGPGGAGAAGTGSVGSSAGYSGGSYSGGGGGGSSGYSYSGGSSGGAGGAGYSGGAGPGASGGAGPAGTGTGGATQLAAAGSGPTAVGQGGGTGAIGGPGGGGGGVGAGADRWQSDGPSPWGTTETPDSSSLTHSDSSLVEDWDPEVDD